MENLATIDFETKSGADLKLTGAYKYAEDDEAEIHCMAFNMGNSGKTKLWTPLPYETDGSIWQLEEDELGYYLQRMDDGSPEELFDHIEEGGLVEAHNSFFEMCIWELVAVPQLFWPDMPKDQWRCSAAKCRSNAIPGGLGMAATALNTEINKDPRGKTLIRLLCVPQKITKKNSERWNTDPGLLGELGEYCIQDVDAEIAVSHSLPEMPQSEIDIWLVDQTINWRGVYVDMESVHAVLEIMRQAKKRFEGELVELSGGAFKTGGQRDKIMDWCKSRGAALAGFTKEHIAKALTRKKLPDDVRRVLEIRQILGRTSTAKYQAILNKVASDGRVHEVLLYHKAHTGRWGGLGIQVQNLPRPTMKFDPDEIVEVLRSCDLDTVLKYHPNPFEVAANAIRPMIMAAPGYRFISADYSAIEARVLSWLSGDEESLQRFRDGVCAYSHMASKIYGIPYETIYDGYKAGDFDCDFMRKVGKDAVLGLGYQMGAPKFMQMCANKDIVISEEFAERVVATYRSEYWLVKELWGLTEKAAKEALQNPGCVFKVGKVAYKFDGKFLMCRLPSGRKIRYLNARLELQETSWGKEKLTIKYDVYKDGGLQSVATYGGKLVENNDQAIARDIMGDAAVRLEKANYPPVMLVHDEAVSEVKESFGTLSEYCKIMEAANDWADGIPLKAEGWVGKRYRK